MFSLIKIAIFLVRVERLPGNDRFLSSTEALAALAEQLDEE